MKNKILKTFLFFVLFSVLFVTASFATTNYYTSVKEDVSTYESTTYIIGSTRIDSSMTITAGVAMNAGYNDAKVKLLLGQDIFTTKPAMYSYDTDFEEWTEVKEDGTTKLLNSSEVEKLEDNLNIFFVNNDEKVLGVPYEGTVDEGSVINPYTGEKETNVTFENNTFYVKALTFEFMFTSNGVTNFVDTNIDTNIEEGKEPTVENMDIIPEGTAITVGKEFFEAEQLKEAIEKSTPENEVKIWDYIELDSSVVLEKENMNAVLNLNWNSLNTTSANYVIELKAPNSVLTIKNGSIHGNKYGAIKVDSKDLNGASATLNLEETVSVQGFDYGLVIFGNKTTANVEGYVGASNVDGYAISGNGNTGWGGTTLNITGNSYISADQGIGIYIPQEGVTNINGENVHIYGKTAIAMKAGELNVINGTLEGNGQKIQIPEETNDGTVGTGDAIYIESNEGYAGNVKINISDDATLNSMCGAPIRVYKSSSTDDINVTGREFVLDVDNTGKIIAYTNDEAAITDGKMNFTANSLQYVLNLYNDGTTIKLLKDIDLPTAVEVTTKVTVDLNGKTLTAKTDTEGNGIFWVKTGGDLTINGEGTIDSACQTNDYSMAVWVTGEGIATINSGTFTNVGAKSVEDDGTTPNNNELIYANGSGKIYINGGTFIGNTDNEKWGTRYTLNLKDNGNATILVTGGTFTAYDPANSKSENPTANLVAEGYESIFDETNNIYTVVEKVN